MDGSEPQEPPEPTINSHDGFDMGMDYISGSSGVFKAWGADGYLKRIKVRFRGYNDKGYGPASASYSYSINLQNSYSTKRIQITSPSPGEEWDSDDSHKIKWNTDGISGDKHMMIRYSPDDGNTWYTIVESTKNDGSKKWDMESDKNLCRHKDTSKARIKIISVEHPEVFSISDKFKIDYKKGHPDC
ncbi:MAG: hypothetical protein HY761_04585 [Candidatus Omnitrophica bacterium]|nr:hypothetical protein [Candidatus Omnitrophota bacterium]